MNQDCPYYNSIIRYCWHNNLMSETEESKVVQVNWEFMGWLHLCWEHWNQLTWSQRLLGSLVLSAGGPKAFLCNLVETCRIFWINGEWNSCTSICLSTCIVVCYSLVWFLAVLNYVIVIPLNHVQLHLRCLVMTDWQLKSAVVLVDS